MTSPDKQRSHVSLNFLLLMEADNFRSGIERGLFQHFNLCYFFQSPIRKILLCQNRIGMLRSQIQNEGRFADAWPSRLQLHEARIGFALGCSGCQSDILLFSILNPASVQRYWWRARYRIPRKAGKAASMDIPFDAWNSTSSSFNNIRLTRPARTPGIPHCFLDLLVLKNHRVT